MIGEDIIEEIRKNRISTSQIADCLGKSGAISSVQALNLGYHRVGRVFWAYAYDESNWELHEQLTRVKAGEIVLVEGFNCNERALFGGLVSKYLVLYREVGAIVVQGLLRDAPHLIKENWPIWCEGLTPIGCFNRKNERAFNPEILKDRRERYENAVAVCDDSGVVIIEQDMINKELLDKLYWIEEQEDIWFDCVDRRKWNTFDTVCLKKYMEKETN